MKLSEIEIVLPAMWIDDIDNEDKRETWRHCSNCNYETTVAHQYCPDCGRKMTNGVSRRKKVINDA